MSKGEWNEWREHVLLKLTAIDEAQEILRTEMHVEHARLHEKLNAALLEFATIKTQAKVWGGVMGLIIGCVPILLQYIVLSK